MNNFNKFIVAVDGPAGTGKSTVCKAIAKKYNWAYFNTGVLYRAIAIIAKIMGLDINDQQKAHEASMIFVNEATWDISDCRLVFRGKDITSELNSDNTARGASIVAKNSEVRSEILPLQRELVKNYEGKGVVIEGRDIGTIIFPNANVKIFLTASLEARAKRRFEQLKVLGEDVNLDQLKESLGARDRQDTDRMTAPMTIATDAYQIDTSNFKEQETIQAATKIIDTFLQK